MRGRQIWTIFTKEMLETVRDRRTLLAMIGIPVLLYPLLAIGVSQLVAMQLAKLTKRSVRLVIVNDHGNALQLLRKDPRVEMHQVQGERAGIQQLRDGLIDAVIVVDKKVEGKRQRILLNYTITEDRSMMARQRLVDMLRRITVRGMVGQLGAKELTLKQVVKLRVVTRNVNPQLRGAFVFGRMIAFMLVLLAVTFPFHPALDLAAGEKERGTLETLLVSPAARREIVLGKYLAVFAVGLLGSLLNLASMALTFSYFADMTKNAALTKSAHFDKTRVADVRLGPDFLLDELEAAPTFDFSIGIGALLKILLALVPLVSLFAAVSLMLSMLAGSYKEGQNYLTPLLVLVMPLSMVAMIPDMHLDYSNAWIPVSNVVLLVKDLFIEKLNTGAFALAIGCTALYAIVSLWATVLVCGREEVLFREVGTVKVGLRPMRPSEVPTPVAALVTFGVAMILIAMINQKLGLMFIKKLGDPYGFPVGTAVGLALLGLLAAFATWYSRAQFRSSLALRRPGLVALVAAVLTGVGGAMLYLPLIPYLIENHFPGLAKQLESMKHLEVLIVAMPLWVRLVVIALLPAVFEELLFRGVILQSFLRKMKPALAILLVSVMFAVAHQHFLRYPATLSVGLLLGWMVYKSGSIWVGVALHAAWNGTSLLAAMWLADKPAFPGWYRPAAILVFLTGVVLFALTRNSAGQVDQPA